MFPCTIITTKRCIGEVLFLNQFFGAIFKAGNETREKICSDFGAEQKWRAERKENGFLHVQLFLREREIGVWKNFLSASEIFFVHVRLLKAVFLQLFVVWLWCCISYRLVLMGIESFE